MKEIDAKGMDYRALNEAIQAAGDDCCITGCLGQRFLAAGLQSKSIRIDGIPGNALGAYLDGARIEVFGNAQDAVGDTMNDGMIIVHGNLGDTAGYAMRGGKIYIAGNAGYRAGIHMKAYQEKLPVMVIGGTAGSFLGEYQAGGRIIVLGLNRGNKPIVSNFPGTGMHGGKMFLRSDCRDVRFADQVVTHTATAEEKAEIAAYIQEFSLLFGFDHEKIIAENFTVVMPDSSNPYQQLYVTN